MLQREVTGLRREVTGLQREVTTVRYYPSVFNLNVADRPPLSQNTSSIYALQRRILIDKARENLLYSYPLAPGPNISNTAMRDSILQRISPEIMEQLGRDAFDMIFTGGIRNDGNFVAHNATHSQISLAITDSRLKDKERECLRRIYVYTEGREPDLEES